MQHLGPDQRKPTEGLFWCEHSINSLCVQHYPLNALIKLPCFLQSVHTGSLMAEGESGSGVGANSVHSVLQKKRQSPMKPSGTPKKKAQQEGSARVKPTGWTCGECLQWFSERDSFVSHVRTTHRKVSCHRSLQNECYTQIRAPVLIKKPKAPAARQHCKELFCDWQFHNCHISVFPSNSR